MTTVFDVPAELLINTVADEFRDNNDKIVAPEWTKLVKTGVHKERKPENIDWWYVRCASILRRVYIDGPVGVRSLRTFYGGKKDRGVNPLNLILDCMALNCISKPDFIAYDHRYNKLSVSLCRNIYHLPEMSWTIRDEDAYNSVPQGTNAIFEGFIPVKK